MVRAAARVCGCKAKAPACSRKECRSHEARAVLPRQCAGDDAAALAATASVSASPARRSCGAGRPPRGRRQKRATLAITEFEYSRGSLGGMSGCRLVCSVCLPAARGRHGSASG